MILREHRAVSSSQDDENQTAYLQAAGRATPGGTGTAARSRPTPITSSCCRATDPKDETASRLVKYLLNNRKHATYWNSTRDTAICIEALADYIKASGEDKPDMTVEVWLDGKKQKEVKIDQDEPVHASTTSSC